MKGTCILHCVTINDDWYCRWMKWLWSILSSWFFNINRDFLTSCHVIMRYQSTKWFASRTLKRNNPRLQSVHTLINTITGDSHLESKVHGANMGPNRTQVGPMLAPWTLLSGHTSPVTIATCAKPITINFICHEKHFIGYEREIKFIGLFGDRGHRGPYSPYKPCNHNLYMRIIIFPHIDVAIICQPKEL